MKVINAQDFRDYETLITSFMCDSSTNMKTYSDLVVIFEKCYKKFTGKSDGSNDLRILDFETSMKEKTWDGDIVLTQDSSTSLITDGIHRGIAYLRCLDSGFSEQSLPRLVIINKDVFDDTGSLFR